MKNAEIKCIIYIKEGNAWKENRVITDETTVYTSLANDLINKKLCNCSYIKSFSRTQNYNGTQTITVYFENNVKRVYTVKDNH